MMFFLLIINAKGKLNIICQFKEIIIISVRLQQLLKIEDGAGCGFEYPTNSYKLFLHRVHTRADSQETAAG